MTTGMNPDPSRSARLLHLVLLGGLVTISMVFLVLTFGLKVAPLLPGGEDVAFIGNVLAAAGIVPIILAMLVLRPRVPARTPGQTTTAFWQGAVGPALVVWTLIEGGGIIGAVGALLTGLLTPVVPAVAALSCLVLIGPSHFENR
jgi:hypothetical protein